MYVDKKCLYSKCCYTLTTAGCAAGNYRHTHHGKAAHSSKLVSHVIVTPRRCKECRPVVDFSPSFVSYSSETQSLCSCRCAAAAAAVFHVIEHSQAFPSDWFALFVNAWGVMELWKGQWCFFCVISLFFFCLFCSRAPQFQQSLSLI